MRETPAREAPPGEKAAPAWAAARVVRAEQGHETRASLLNAAALVFARLGYARTTVADITAAADVSRATFYVYFASKAEVFAVVAAWVRLLITSERYAEGSSSRPSA